MPWGGGGGSNHTHAFVDCSHKHRLLLLLFVGASPSHRVGTAAAVGGQQLSARTPGRIHSCSAEALVCSSWSSTLGLAAACTCIIYPAQPLAALEDGEICKHEPAHNLWPGLASKPHAGPLGLQVCTRGRLHATLQPLAWTQLVLTARCPEPPCHCNRQCFQLQCTVTKLGGAPAAARKCCRLPGLATSGMVAARAQALAHCSLKRSARACSHDGTGGAAKCVW